MNEVFEGRCQCGKVNYRVTGQSIALFACHCTDCQKQSSSAFGMALWVRKFNKQLTSGTTSSWTRTMPSGKELIGDLCSLCGTRLFHQVAGQDEVLSIKPGTLLDTRGLEPVAHIWTASSQGWMTLPAGILQYPGNPPNYDEILKEWRRRLA